MPSPVIDLSHNNPTPDWKALKQNGVIAVILKCTENISYVDPTWQERSVAAKQAGLLLAPYHFFHASNIQKQMDWFLSKADPPHGGRVVLDHETDASVNELCEAVTYLWDKRPDLQITIYSGHTIKEQLGTLTSRDELRNTSLWIAQYTSAGSPVWPKQQWPQWSLWQWTDRETVPGIAKPVDGNKFNGTSEALVRFMSSTAEQPMPAPEPDRPVIVISMPEGYKLMVNGKEVVA